VPLTAEEFYRLPELKIFKNYPVYAPGKEPAGYMETLRQAKPEVIFDSSLLRTEKDWCTAVEQFAWHAATGDPAYQYEFARVSPEREANGATHAAELPYVFGTLDHPIVIPGLPAQVATAVDTQVSSAMQQYWTNFAKTGDPNGGQLPVWPKFDTSTRAYIPFLDTGPVAKAGLRRPYCDVFMENLERLRAK
jgi:carboxylesterase type B